MVSSSLVPKPSPPCDQYVFQTKEAPHTPLSVHHFVASLQCVPSHRDWPAVRGRSLLSRRQHRRPPRPTSWPHPHLPTAGPGPLTTTASPLRVTHFFSHPGSAAVRGGSAHAHGQLFFFLPVFSCHARRPFAQCALGVVQAGKGGGSAAAPAGATRAAGGGRAWLPAVQPHRHCHCARPRGARQRRGGVAGRRRVFGGGTRDAATHAPVNHVADAFAHVPSPTGLGGDASPSFPAPLHRPPPLPRLGAADRTPCSPPRPTIHRARECGRPRLPAAAPAPR